MASPLPAAPPSFTVEAYLAWLDENPGLRAELIDGEIVMMSGAAARHNVIAGNVFASLHGPMRRRGCQTFVADMIVRRANADDFAALPDVFVRCGPLGDDRARTIDDPVVVFEVLSPSTERKDRGRKFVNYESMPSLRAYVLVHQGEPRIEVWARPDGVGVLRPRPAVQGLGATLDLPEIEAVLRLSDVYDGVDLT